MTLRNENGHDVVGVIVWFETPRPGCTDVVKRSVMRPPGASAPARARIRVATVSSVAGCSRMSIPVACHVMRVLLVLALASSACGGAPSGPPDIVGIVTSVGGRPEGVTVLVESDPSTPFTGAKAAWRSAAERVSRGRPGGDVAATMRDLIPGMPVEVWLTDRSRRLPVAGQGECAVDRR